MRQWIQPLDDEGISISILLRRNVKVAFDLLGTGGNDSVQAMTTFKEMLKKFSLIE